MRLTQEQTDNLFSHFPVEDSLDTLELFAVSFSLHDEGVEYFLTDRHATQEVFGARELPVQRAIAAPLLGELTLQKAS